MAVLKRTSWASRLEQVSDNKYNIELINDQLEIVDATLDNVVDTLDGIKVELTELNGAVDKAEEDILANRSAIGTNTNSIVQLVGEVEVVKGNVGFVEVLIDVADLSISDNFLYINVPDTNASRIILVFTQAAIDYIDQGGAGGDILYLSLKHVDRYTNIFVSQNSYVHWPKSYGIETANLYYGEISHDVENGFGITIDYYSNTFMYDVGRFYVLLMGSGINLFSFNQPRQGEWNISLGAGYDV